MNVKPLADRILVRRLEEPETKRGGIIIPDTAKEKPQQAEVVATGPGRLTDDGKRIALEVKAGELVSVCYTVEYARAVTIDIMKQLSFSGVSRFEAPATVRVSASRPAFGNEITLHLVNYNREEPKEKKSAGRGNPSAKLAYLAVRSDRAQQVIAVIGDDDRDGPLRSGDHADVAVVSVHEADRLCGEPPMELNDAFGVDHFARSTAQHQQIQIEPRPAQRINLCSYERAECRILACRIDCCRDQNLHSSLSMWKRIIARFLGYERRSVRRP